MSSPLGSGSRIRTVDAVRGSRGPNILYWSAVIVVDALPLPAILLFVLVSTTLDADAGTVGERRALVVAVGGLPRVCLGCRAAALRRRVAP